ncbi:hypothetical protein CR162_20410 [Pseudoroseomonas rhizosphaerae]|uniref:HTH cro/C1-type domain-containing protein n=1 Tax=Teichococcus rhizosphaerae TaxID=1335062 RepID=A0A2C7A414_9PROT|nr:helix-turn-helix domain-containing protein [Pseudoroseomonas rhizosphaerae]PHK93090.1 hypothetical protein CR162_20410 [Pseudoroseomonas rhizosphaerae]
MPYEPKRPNRSEEKPAEALRVGEELREARLSLGISLEEMAERLRINRRYIAALEDGRIADLPGAAYAIGFVRSYAQAMGLDAPDLVRRFREAAGKGPRGRDLVFPEPVPERGVPTGAVILVGALLAIGAYAGWYRWSGSGERVVDAVPDLPPRLDQAAREAGSPPLPGLPPGGAPAAPATPGPPGPPATTPPVAVPPLAAPLAPMAQPPAMPPAAPSAGGDGAGSATASASPPAAEAAPLAGRIVLRATQESWVRVSEARGNRVVFERVLQPGETYEVPQTPGLLLNTGRIEGLVAEVDGVPSPAFTDNTGVRRDILLDPARLREAPPGQLPTR